MASLATGNVVDAADKAMEKMDVKSSSAKEASNTITTKAKEDKSGVKMTAVQWSGTKNVNVGHVPKPAVTDDRDAIIRVTSSGLCGTDLHLYLGCVPGMKSGRILGHEPMGYVESVGPNVTSLKPGDRVVVSCQIACGDCHFCKEQLFSMCDRTNPSGVQEKMLGQRTAGLLGFSEMNAGLDGGQADFVRVPFADVNCLKVPSEAEISDDKLVLLSDILCTAWYGTELAEVGHGDVIAIWGAGPVGLLAAQCSFARGARRVIIVDEMTYRLEFAKKILPKIETVNFSEDHTSTAGEKLVLELCKSEPARAPDACIECVGMHYAHSFLHQVEMAVGMETDTPEALNAAIFACKKGGRIAAIGAYVGMANHFNIGALMEKCISLKTGQIPVQKYWSQLLGKIQSGELDPSVIITHKMSLDDAPKAYQLFNEKLDNAIKVVFTPAPNSGK